MHQLSEVYAALGNPREADSMRQEVRAKVKDVREVVDETLARAAAKSAQAHIKVDELKAQVLSHWHEAQRCALANLGQPSDLRQPLVAVLGHLRASPSRLLLGTEASS